MHAIKLSTCDILAFGKQQRHQTEHFDKFKFSDVQNRQSTD